MRLLALVRDPGARWVLVGWSAFTLENLLLSEYRPEFKKLWGGKGSQEAFQRTYSTLSTLTLGATCFSFWRFSHASPVLREPTLQGKVAGFVLRAGGLCVLSQLMPPICVAGLTECYRTAGATGCPFDFNAYGNRGEVYGVTRVTRRPELVGLVAVGLGATLCASSAAQLAFFGVGPVLSCLALGLHSDRVQRRSGQLSEAKEAATSMLPLQA